MEAVPVASGLHLQAVDFVGLHVSSQSLFKELAGVLASAH